MNSPSDHPEALAALLALGMEATETQWPVLPEPADGPLRENPGTMIGRYKLLEQIGEGGFGVVFMAEQQSPVRRMVALKIIKLGMDTRQVVARFEAERQALALMDHPNIARVLDAGSTESGRPYFVMELVKGVPINVFCDENKLSTRERLELFVQVCSAVQHAHQKGIIHRDLKPSNVLVALHDDKPVPKVIDFGIAKAMQSRLTERTLFTEFKQLLGTPAYMSPEQAKLNALDVDTRSDVYALGVLLYELLTGSTPFDGAALRSAAYEEMCRILREVDPPTPSTRVNGLAVEALNTTAGRRGTDPRSFGRAIKGELDWIVMKALEKDRTRRYQTASGLAQDLERFLADQPVEAGPISRWYKLRKTVRRHKPAVLATAVTAAALMLATTVSTWQAIEATRAKALAQAAEQDARQHEEIAVSVNKFFCGQVLGIADPGQQPDQKSASADITVREALDKAAAALDGQFADKPPWVKGGIHNSIGRAYEALGIYDKAEQHLQESLRLGGGPPFATVGDLRDYLGDVSSLAELYLEEWQVHKAEPLIKEAVERAQAGLGEDDDQTLAILCSLSNYYCARKDYEKAEAVCRKVLDAKLRKYGGLDANVLVMRHNLGVIYLERHQLAEAIETLQKAVEGERKSMGDQWPGTLAALGDLARAYRDAGQYEQSEKAFRESVEGTRRLYGVDHPRTRTLMSRMATLYERQGREAEAEPLLREAAEWCLAHLDGEPALVPDGTPYAAMMRLSDCYRALGQEKKAAEWSQHAADISAVSSK